MRDRPSIVFGTLLLAGANIALQGAAMGFRVWLSRRVGAAGLGLLQLVLSVGALARTAGVSGARVAALYLCAGELGRGRPGGVRRALEACARYCLAMSTAAGLFLLLGANVLAARWIGDGAAAPALRLLGLFLPADCLGAVLGGYFTAAGRIRQLVAAEALERVVSIGLTVLLLRGSADACRAVVLGGGLGSLLSMCLLGGLCLRALPRSAPIPMTGRMLKISVPLALGDYARAGLSTCTNLLIPRGLARSGRADAMAAYGVVHGMVLPALWFPAAFLFALVDLLIPELSRARAMGQTERIRTLTDRCFRASAVFACACAGTLHLSAAPLARAVYHNAQAGEYLAVLAPMIVFLYLDAVTDGLLKGLGQQLHCVRCTILTSTLEVAGLWLLLPRLGVTGYILCFAVTRLLNYLLSAARLWRIACPLPARFCVKLLVCFGGSVALFRAAPLFLPGFFAALLLSRTVTRSDLRHVIRDSGFDKGEKRSIMGAEPRNEAKPCTIS